MAAIPSSVGGDLPPQVGAHKHGHDLDIRPEPQSSHAVNGLSDQQGAGLDKSNTSVPMFNEREISDVEKCPIADVAKDEDETKGQDANIVDWDGPDDPANPQNWYVNKEERE